MLTLLTIREKGVRGERIVIKQWYLLIHLSSKWTAEQSMVWFESQAQVTEAAPIKAAANLTLTLTCVPV